MKTQRHFSLPRFAAFAIAALSIADVAQASDWLQFGYDQSHSGNNSSESIINQANVSSLVQIADVSVSFRDAPNTAPVFLEKVQTAQGVKDLLFYGTFYGSIYAVDASNGSVIWSQKPLSSSGYNPNSSTPAIDPNRLFVYYFAMDGRVHKYDVTNGNEVLSSPWPVVATLKVQSEHASAALAFSTHAGRSTYIYAVTNGYYGDGGDYQGHLTTIDADTGASTVFNALCSNLMFHMVQFGSPGTNDCGDTRAGIWGRPGSTYDPSTDRVYITTGNGNYNANMGGWNWGDSVLALDGSGSGDNLGNPLDSYTPAEYADLDRLDIDLGSGAVAILPTPSNSRYPHLGTVVGKDSLLRLLNLADMSGSHGPRFVGGELQIATTRDVEDIATPQGAVWVNTHGDGATWMFQPRYTANLQAFKLTVDASGNPSLTNKWSNGQGLVSPIVANDVLFAGNINSQISAYSPTTGDVLWSCPAASGTQFILVNGRLYLLGGYLTIYALNDHIFSDSFE